MIFSHICVDITFSHIVIDMTFSHICIDVTYSRICVDVTFSRTCMLYGIITNVFVTIKCSVSLKKKHIYDFTDLPSLEPKVHFNTYKLTDGLSTNTLKNYGSK